MVVEPRQSIKTYPQPVGACIYCGVRGNNIKLSREHIIPEGLGNGWILQQASCRECARVTGTIIEMPVLRRMFGELRFHHGIRIKERKPRPQLYVRRGRWAYPVLASVDERPFGVVLPTFSDPDILTGSPPRQSNEWPGVILFAHNERPKKFMAWANSHGASRATMHAMCNVELFARMLAKIGHSFATAEIGYGNFRPLLPEFILGRVYNPQYLIGGRQDPLPAGENRHELSWEIRKSLDGRSLIVVTIRLFSNLRFPVYYVVAGEP